MWQISEVLKFDGQLYRILSINFGDIFWIQIDNKNALPEVVREESLYEYLDNERLTRAKDPFANLILEEPTVNSIAFAKRDKKEAWKVFMSLRGDVEGEAIQGALWWKFQGLWQSVKDGKKTAFTQEECERIGGELVRSTVRAHRGERDLLIELERIILSI